MKPNWFIGLPLEGGEWISPLLDHAPRKVRVFSLADMHVTLSFLGPCSEKMARKAWNMAIQNPPSKQILYTREIRAMGKPGRPSAFSLLFDGDEKIYTWMSSNGNAILKSIGGRVRSGQPLPHMTIARPQRKSTATQRQKATDWCNGLDLSGKRMVLSRMALYTWSRDRRKRLFDVVDEILLGSFDSNADEIK